MAYRKFGKEKFKLEMFRTKKRLANDDAQVLRKLGYKVRVERAPGGGYFVWRGGKKKRKRK